MYTFDNNNKHRLVNTKSDCITFKIQKQLKVKYFLGSFGPKIVFNREVNFSICKGPELSEI